MASDLLALLDTLDGLREDAADGCTPEHSDAGWCTWAKACLNDSPADTALVVALRLAYPRLAQALRTALTPTTDGEREAVAALAKHDAPRCGRDVITGEDEERVWAGYCERPPGHDGACAMLGRCAGIDPDHLRTALALLTAERAEHAMLRASLTVPERYVGVVTDAMVEEVEQLRAKAADAARERETWVCDCGLPMSRNPHPDAGKPAALLDVGAVWVCIPCTVKSRHGATTARFQAERDRDEAQAQERIRCAQAMQDTAATVTGTDPYHVGVRTALESFARGLLAEVTP